MKLVDALPKNEEGKIIFSPAGRQGDELFDGLVNAAWFSAVFPDLANAEVPLSDEKYNELSNIDWAWEANAERWRSEGII